MNVQTTKNACFVMAQLPDGTFAATSRLESGKFGLPGGKQDDGESLFETAIRESSEEGWDIEVEKDWFFSTFIGGFQCFWFFGKNPQRHDNFKERGRIEPIALTIGKIIESAPDLGNKEAFEYYRKKLSRVD